MPGASNVSSVNNSLVHVTDILPTAIELVEHQHPGRQLPDPLGDGEWELFNRDRDPGEQTNVVANNPQRVGEMMSVWKN